MLALPPASLLMAVRLGHVLVPVTALSSPSSSARNSVTTEGACAVTDAPACAQQTRLHPCGVGRVLALQAPCTATPSRGRSCSLSTAAKADASPGDSTETAAGPGGRQGFPARGRVAEAWAQGGALASCKKDVSPRGRGGKGTLSPVLESSARASWLCRRPREERSRWLSNTLLGLARPHSPPVEPPAPPGSPRLRSPHTAGVPSRCLFRGQRAHVEGRWEEDKPRRSSFPGNVRVAQRPLDVGAAALRRARGDDVFRPPGLAARAGGRRPRGRCWPCRARAPRLRGKHIPSHVWVHGPRRSALLCACGDPPCRVRAPVCASLRPRVPQRARSARRPSGAHGAALGLRHGSGSHQSTCTRLSARTPAGVHVHGPHGFGLCTVPARPAEAREVSVQGRGTRFLVWGPHHSGVSKC